MTAQIPTVLKTYFETGDKPTQVQFGNLIDSYINTVQTAAQTIISDVSALGKVDVTGNFTVKASSQANFTGNIIVSGNANITGSLTVAGSSPLTASSVATFTNKTYDTAGTGNVFKINGATVTAQDNGVNDFRLTLTSVTPVTTSDVTGATTIYCTPYKGNRIYLYDGTNWNLRTSAEFSLALGTLTNGKPYDVFCYDNAGVPTLEFLVWTNDTTRATALVYQDGRLVKSGAATRLYLGSFYTTAATTTEDSLAKRYLYNYYNRVRRSMKVTDGTTTWTYTTATVRQANGNAANQLNYLQGVAEDDVEATISSQFTNSSSGIAVQVGIGFDSTSTFSGIPTVTANAANAVPDNAHGFYRAIPAAGRHFLSWNEWSTATGTTTWTGTNNLTVSGIHGSILA